MARPAPSRLRRCAVIASMLCAGGCSSLVRADDASQQANEPVRVIVGVAEYQCLRLDPKHPPAEKASYAAESDAFTHCQYSLRWQIGHDTEVLPPNGRSGTTVRIKVTSVGISTAFRTTIWLPDDASSALIEHEQGHRQIGERSYASAAIVARSIGQAVIGQAYEAAGVDKAAAEAAARQKAGNGIWAEYNGRLRDRAQSIHRLYDDLTDHGRDRRMGVAHAIEEAYRQFVAGKR